MIFISVDHKRTIVAANRFNFDSIIKMSYPDRKIIFSIFSLMKQLNESNNYTLTIQSNYLRKLSNNTRMRGHAFLQHAIKLCRSLVTTYVLVDESSDNPVFMPLFSKLVAHKDTQQIELKVNKELLPYFIDLSDNYFWFLLDDSNKIRSRVSLKVFVLLSQYRYLGKVHLSIDDAKQLFNYQGNSRPYLTQSLKRATSRLSPYFKNIKVKAIYQPTNTSQVVTSYLITFNRESFHKSTIKSLSKDIKISDTDLPF